MHMLKLQDVPQGLKPNERDLLMSELKLRPLKGIYETESREPERGLYSGLVRGIQELQKWADALSPGGFVVLRAFDALVVQVLFELPAFFEQHIAEFFHLRHDAGTFARADIQPDARAGLDDRRPREAVNHLLVPPNRWREGGDFPENARMLEAQVERNKSAQGGAADAGVLRAGERAVFAVDEGLHFFDEKFGIAIGAAAAEFGNVSRRVFANAGFGVVHADDDQRGDGADLNAVIGGLADVPILPGDEGCGAVEKILAVMKIEDGKMARGLLGVSGRSVNDEVALIAEKARAELFVFAELSGTHGAMATRRSLASTCWPEVTRIFTMRPEMGA